MKLNLLLPLLVFSDSSLSLKIPTVDMSVFEQALDADPIGQYIVAKELETAAQDMGVVYITGHGISVAEQKAAFDAARRLFELDARTKAALKSPPRSGFTRGFIPLGGESGSQSTIEVKEGFSYGYPWSPNLEPLNPLQGPNVWPTEMQGFSTKDRQVLETVFSELVKVALNVVKAIEVAMGWNPSVVEDVLYDGDTISLLRVFHYMAKNSSEHKKLCTGLRKSGTCIGSSPHTDWGFLTLIMQDMMGPHRSLEVQHQGKWHTVDAPEEEGALVMNAGDFLAVLTHGKFTSPVHRVLLDPKEERYSFVLFYYPNFETELFDGMDDDSYDGAAELKRRLSIFDFQGDDGNSMPNPKHHSFGEYMMMKWGEVGRETPGEVKCANGAE